ncbi:MAG: response regulator [Deltaproteobacteria bacterium]|nr:response regulator [Deltaproteobacteria bacterium]
MWILHVEDDDGNSSFAARVLESDGHAVVRATNARAALEVLDHWRPDLILLDIGLPDMDGFELVKRARAQGLLDGVPIIAVTGWVGWEFRERARCAGFADFLEKPLRLAELRRAVARVPGTSVRPDSGARGIGG